MNIIQNNPYRTLGVYAGAPLKEITANTSKIQAYAKVSKPITFPADLTTVLSLPKPKRDEAAINEANAKINLPIDKIKYAMFWFVHGDSMNEVALNHLQADSGKSLEIWNKKNTYSSYINKAILAFIWSQPDSAINNITAMIHDEACRNNFIKSIAGETFSISETELAHLFIDTLLEENKASILLKLFEENGKSEEDDEYLKKKVVEAPIKQIESEIAKACSIDRKDAIENYNAGIALMNNTKTALANVKVLLGATDMQYQMLADNLAKTILQCGINYFNNTDDTDDVEKALTIQEYASRIAVGQMVKDRCKENVDILKQKKIESAVSADIAIVANELNSFGTKAAIIENARNHVNNCKPHLANIKAVLGSTNDLYLKISSAVAGNALGMLIAVVNKAQESSSSGLSHLKIILDDSISVMNLIKMLDMDSATRTRFNTNSGILSDNQSKILSQIQRAMAPLPTHPQYTKAPLGQLGQPSKGPTPPPRNTNRLGCMIFFVVAIIIIIIANL